MASDFAHVPTEGLQATYLRLLHEAAERLDAVRGERDRHDRAFWSFATATPEEQRQYASDARALNGRVLGAVDSLLAAVDRARKAGALGVLPDLEREADLRCDYADADGVPL
jgi:hypothetical protein